jgi:dephospho-CoA kinase
MLKIGITGCIGSGKTTICRVFEHLGIEVYYSDAKAKQFYNEIVVKQKIRNLFGDAVFDAEQNVDVKELATIVFQNEMQLQKLNRLMHPLVIDDFQKWCGQRENQPFVLFESAIIYQCGLEAMFDKIIFVDAPVEILLQRAVVRDNADRETIKQRLKQQQNHNSPSLPDFIIRNDEKQSLMQEIMRIYAILMQQSEKRQGCFLRKNECLQKICTI